MQSLDGVLDELSGKNMTEAGPRKAIDHDSRGERGEVVDRLDDSLPGVKRGSMTSRSTVSAIRWGTGEQNKTEIKRGWSTYAILHPMACVRVRVCGLLCM